jgi:hypothetical protein
MLKILEGIWTEIRRRHREIPDVIIVIASRADGKHTRIDHYASDRRSAAGETRAEIVVGGECLQRSADDVLGILLHEAAHALAAMRGIQDTSRQGRYHNSRFARLARELGINVDKDPKIGWIPTTVTTDTARDYAAALRALGDAITLWRSDEVRSGRYQRRNTNLIAASCPCDRNIRVAASTLAAAPITCEVCHGEFGPRHPDA